MMRPRVGVIIPCFNQGEFAGECVASLHAQTFRDWRAVIVDDASTDGSAALLEPLADERVAVVHLDRNRGRALVRNKAVARLGGEVEFVLNVDCDDRLTPDYLEKLLRALEEHPRAGLAYGTLRFFGREADAGRTWPDKSFDFERRYLENEIPGPGVLFRFAALAKTGGWRREFTSGGEDWDIWLQVVEAGWEVVWVREAVYEYRQHPDSFLAQRTSETLVDMELNLLRLHAREIRGSCGLRTFLSRHMLPALLAALREGRLGRAAAIAAPLARHAPWAALSLAAGHYTRRLRAMLRR